METLVKLRIREYFSNEKKMSERAFSESLSIGQRTFNKQMKEESAMPLRTILLILRNNPDLSAEWLLRGTNPMYKSDSIVGGVAIGDGAVNHSNSNVVIEKFLKELEEERMMTKTLASQNQTLIDIVRDSLNSGSKKPTV